MPDVSSAGTLTKSSLGCSNLGAKGKERSLLFAGTSVGTSCTIQYTDDAGTDRVIANGTITELPSSALVRANVDLKIVTTGSPDFNVTIVVQ